MQVDRAAVTTGELAWLSKDDEDTEDPGTRPDASSPAPRQPGPGARSYRNSGLRTWRDAAPDELAARVAAGNVGTHVARGAALAVPIAFAPFAWTAVPIREERAEMGAVAQREAAACAQRAAPAEGELVMAHVVSGSASLRVTAADSAVEALDGRDARIGRQTTAATVADGIACRARAFDVGAEAAAVVLAAGGLSAFTRAGRPAASLLLQVGERALQRFGCLTFLEGIAAGKGRRGARAVVLAERAEQLAADGDLLLALRPGLVPGPSPVLALPGRLRWRPTT